VAYTTIYKKPKKKTSAQGGGSSAFGLVLTWVFCCAVFLWLAWVMWVGRGGPYGTAVSAFFFKFFGQAYVFIPAFLLYWLWRSIKARSLAVVTLLSGVLLTISGIATEMALLKSIFEKSSISGGLIGGWFFSRISDVAGTAGAVLLGLVFIFVGVHILFAVPWLATVRKTGEILKEDFNAWMKARAEFKQKVDEAKGKQPAAAPRRVVAQEEDEKPRQEAAPAPKPLPKISRPVAEMVKMPPRQEVKVKQAELFSKEELNEVSDKYETFELPPLSLLSEPIALNLIGPSDEEIASATKRLEDTLKSFDIAASVTGVAPGPVVTRYEIKPDPGVKISSIVSISNDIALAMKARGIRVEAPIPGKDAIGFEIPNDKPLTVTLREILQDAAFVNSKFKTSIALGRYADGGAAVVTISKMPHLLVAGATNSGKSICIHSIIVSLLYRAKPNEIKFLLIDPKRVELTLYEGIPHLYDPKTDCADASVVKDANGAVKSLQALVKVMEKRMKIFEIAKVKNIESYNIWAGKNKEEKMFYIVVVIDELADLMLQTKAAIEDSVQRLTQMGRALGIHLILSTQRPSTNVITGVIKANLPSRIALQVSSKIDSRVVIDANGADALLGKGDMLYLGISDPKPNRVQGAYVSEEEITKVADFLRAQGGPDYPFQIVPEQSAQQNGGEGLGTSPEEMSQALTLIKERRRVSQDLLKAHFGSSARATNILSVLEMKGFITKPEGSNRWEIHFDLIEGQLNELQNSKPQEEESYDTVYK
jgi:S-DNA-T family DNA segregation ATPase FtsK/SpoIIIE